MKLWERLHSLHRCWRFRLRSEKDSVRYLLKQYLQGKTVLDIGANHGVYSYWLSKQVGSTGRVIAFEPQPEMAEYISDLRGSFGLKNLLIENVGLSDVAGSSHLARAKVGDGGASIVEQASSEGARRCTIPVEIDTLDNRLVAYGSPQISFIKCDVEGHELKVFRGAVDMLTRDHPTLLFECHDPEAKEGSLFSFLTDLGYDGFFFDGSRKVHYADFAKVPYVPGNFHRNYIFQAQQSQAVRAA